MNLEEIEVDKVKIDQDQPRSDFDQERLMELANSIEEVGQLQPIIVVKKEDHFQLIAGERRLRAIRSREQSTIRALVMDSGVNARQIQLIENLQRQDLNVLERAHSIKEYIDDNDLTKKEAASKLGIPRTTLTEWLNILEVKPEFQKEVLNPDSPLTLSHITLARGLASRTGDPYKQRKLLEGVIKYSFSRAETKEIVDLFGRYLHLEMEKAFSAIILKRERSDLLERMSQTENSNQKQGEKTVAGLLNSLNRVGESLEEYMSRQGPVEDEKKRADLLGEFLYIYQLMETMLPELKENRVKDLVVRMKDKHTQ